MAYDRYDSRDLPRDERSRWGNERTPDGRRSSHERSSRGDDRQGGRRDDRGFFERAGDEIASWFGDEDAERRRHPDHPGDPRTSRGSWSSRDRDRDDDRGYDRDRDHSAFSANREPHHERGGSDRDRDRGGSSGRHENWNDNRGTFASGGSSERDYDRNWRQEYSREEFDPRQADRQVDRGWSDRYRPMTGDYGRSSPSRDDDLARSQSKWAEDEYRGTSRAGSANWSDRSRDDRSERAHDDRLDPHYRSWRDRHLSDLDRDYDDYRAENRSQFESDFGSWRERRQQKRGLLREILEGMEVVGSDDKPVGTVEKTAGDRLILAKSDPESGGMHHSMSCSDIEKIEGKRVLLSCTADQARHRWRDESRGRALFEGDDQGEMGPRILDRSFDGTYR